MDFAAGLECDGPVAVKYQLVCPAVAIVREAVRPRKQHRINEAALHFGSHEAIQEAERQKRAGTRMVEDLFLPRNHDSAKNVRVSVSCFRVFVFSWQIALLQPPEYAATLSRAGRTRSAGIRSRGGCLDLQVDRKDVAMPEIAGGLCELVVRPARPGSGTAR